MNDYMEKIYWLSDGKAAGTLEAMAVGIIKRESIDQIRERIDLKDVVERVVTLKNAGIGSWKGLCPFHDERTPSFTVKPQAGFYHCFGCGESGDVFSFLMKTEHVNFAEAIEQLSNTCGVTVQYEEGNAPSHQSYRGSKQNIFKINQAASEFFQSKLLSSEAQIARNFMTSRGFTTDMMATYTLGYAPQGWGNLQKHLRGRGYAEHDMIDAGVLTTGPKGTYDRFRGRLIWPIKDVSGNILGFGARKLYEEDPGPKYLNTPETQAYKKSHVLYGLDFAKKAISTKKKVVIVEGYTDVMACHAAGIDMAVATCGTAFGVEHIKIIRRLISDDQTAEVIFTFDGDAAGQQAALKAFDQDQRFIAQTFVAIDPSEMDPCEIRVKKGDDALRELITSKKPLCEFTLRTIFAHSATDTVEQRVATLKAMAPILHKIKNSTIKTFYMRKVAGWLGLDVQDIDREMRFIASQHASHVPSSHQFSEVVQKPVLHKKRIYQRPDPANPFARVEREVLEVMLQHPGLLSEIERETFMNSDFSVEAYAEVALVLKQAISQKAHPSNWLSFIRTGVPEVLIPLVSELTLRPLPVNTEHELTAYVHAMMNRLVDVELERAKSEAQRRLHHLDSQATSEQLHLIQKELLDIELKRRALKEE